jgi:trans-aconitate 2-methyltransferase
VDLLFTNAALQWVCWIHLYPAHYRYHPHLLTRVPVSWLSLQLPDHLSLITHLMAQLTPGGIFANQIPNDFDQKSHTLMHSIAASFTSRGLIPPTVLPRLDRTSAQVQAGGLARYYDHLRPLSSYVDVWETRYMQTISCPVNDHPVAHFLSGSSLNQWLHEMPEGVREEMRAEYVREVEKAYPSWKSVGEDGKEEVTACFPFSRYFMVAVKK